jgi:hypothetical protein
MIGMSSRVIAAKLNELKIAAPRGGAWSHKTTQRVMARLGVPMTRVYAWWRFVPMPGTRYLRYKQPS